MDEQRAEHADEPKEKRTIRAEQTETLNESWNRNINVAEKMVPAIHTQVQNLQNTKRDETGTNPHTTKAIWRNSLHYAVGRPNPKLLERKLPWFLATPGRRCIIGWRRRRHEMNVEATAKKEGKKLKKVTEIKRGEKKIFPPCRPDPTSRSAVWSSSWRRCWPDLSVSCDNYDLGETLTIRLQPYETLCCAFAIDTPLRWSQQCSRWPNWILALGGLELDILLFIHDVSNGCIRSSHGHINQNMIFGHIWSVLVAFVAKTHFVIRAVNFCQLMQILAHEGAMFLTGIKKFKKRQNMIFGHIGLYWVRSWQKLTSWFARRTFVNWYQYWYILAHTGAKFLTGMKKFNKHQDKIITDISKFWTTRVRCFWPVRKSSKSTKTWFLDIFGVYWLR